MIFALFTLAAGVGAILRAMITNYDTAFDRQVLSTAAINIVGSFLLGLIAGSDWGSDAITVVGVGGLGALTTFSTFVAQTEKLASERNPLIAGLYLGASLLLGAIAAYAGWRIL